MSIPIITSGTGSRCQAISDLIESVALEQAAISHMLNAEGEKMQKIVRLATSTEILQVEQSVEQLINSITSLEIVLQNKLSLFSNCLCENCPCQPISNVDITTEVENIDVAKGSNTSFEITNFSATQGLVEFNVQVTPNYPVELVSTTTPAAVTLNGNTLSIDFSQSQTGDIVLRTGRDECTIEILIQYFTV